MNKIFSGLMLMLMSFSALAQDDAAVIVAPKVDADPTGMIVFAVVFVALIGGYVGYIWVKERKRNRTGE